MLMSTVKNVHVKYIRRIKYLYTYQYVLRNVKLKYYNNRVYFLYMKLINLHLWCSHLNVLKMSTCNWACAGRPKFCVVEKSHIKRAVIRTINQKTTVSLREMGVCVCMYVCVFASVCAWRICFEGWEKPQGTLQLHACRLAGTLASSS